MASRATSYWRTMASRFGGNRLFATTTTPKTAYAPTANFTQNQSHKQRVLKADFVPVYVGAGFVLLALMLGLHTAKQHLMYAPGVYVSKKKREAIPEVKDPDYVVHIADEFITKSLLRRVAYIQDQDQVIPNPIRVDPFKCPRKAETLKSVGIDVSDLS